MSGVQIIRDKNGKVEVKCSLDFVKAMANSFKVSADLERRVQQNREQIIAESFRRLAEYRAVRNR